MIFTVFYCKNSPDVWAINIMEESESGASNYKKVSDSYPNSNSKKSAAVSNKKTYASLSDFKKPGLGILPVAVAITKSNKTTAFNPVKESETLPKIQSEPVLRRNPETVQELNVSQEDTFVHIPANSENLLKENSDIENTEDLKGELSIPEDFKKLPYYYPENSTRYLKYKELHPELDYETAILYVNMGLDNPFYTGIKTVHQPSRIDVLVNKYNRLPDNYMPELVEVPDYLCARGVGKQYLRKEAKEAFERMYEDAQKLGLDITIYGSYRSIEMQNDIWNRKVNSGKTLEEVERFNARGGHSEHNTGLAIDVIKNNYSVLETEEYKWYKANAHKYGFIIRYPEGEDKITGYSYEPWHLRYLGEELAAKVYDSGLAYEKYYAMNIEPYYD